MRGARGDGVPSGVVGYMSLNQRQASKERRRSMPTRILRIVHRLSGQVLAEGPPGWGITRFEGNYYVSRKYLRTSALKANWVPGVCLYKGLSCGWISDCPASDGCVTSAGSIGCPTPCYRS